MQLTACRRDGRRHFLDHVIRHRHLHVYQLTLPVAVACFLLSLGTCTHLCTQATLLAGTYARTEQRNTPSISSLDTLVRPPRSPSPSSWLCCLFRCFPHAHVPWGGALLLRTYPTILPSLHSSPLGHRHAFAVFTASSVRSLPSRHHPFLFLLPSSAKDPGGRRRQGASTALVQIAIQLPSFISGPVQYKP